MTADEIARILDTLGERLGPAGEYVFQLAVRQQLIEGWTMLVVLLLGIATLGVSIRFFGPEWRNSEVSAPWVVGMLGAVATGVGGIALVTGGIGKLLNPEYAALTDLLSRIVP